jgi:hypothetical protein
MKKFIYLDLHYRLNNNHSSSSSEQEVRNIDQPSSPTPDPSIDGMKSINSIELFISIN